jgi:hypothetical protein
VTGVERSGLKCVRVCVGGNEVVPTRAMKAYVGVGCSSTHSLPECYVELSLRLHAAVAQSLMFTE